MASWISCQFRLFSSSYLSYKWALGCTLRQEPLPLSKLTTTSHQVNSYNDLSFNFTYQHWVLVLPSPCGGNMDPLWIFKFWQHGMVPLKYHMTIWWWKKVLHHLESNWQTPPAQSYKQNNMTTTPFGSTLTVPLMILDQLPWMTCKSSEIQWQETELYWIGQWIFGGSDWISTQLQ